LELGWNVYEMNDMGKTPLHLAAAGKDSRIFTLLLDKYDDVDQQDNTGRTALHVLLGSYGGMDIIQRLEALLAKGANIHLQNCDQKTALDDYCLQGVHILQWPNSRNTWCDGIISKLIDHEATFNAETKSSIERILTDLVDIGLLEDAEAFLHAMGTLDLEKLMNRGGDHELLIFLYLKRYPDDKLLPFLQRLSLSGLERFFSVDLGERCASGMACAELFDPITHHMATTQAVLCAAKDGNKNLLEYLIERCYADPAVPEWPSLRSALSYAAGNGHIAAAEYLISKKIPLEAADADNRTPLWWAEKEERLEVVQLLREKGAKS